MGEAAPAGRTKRLHRCRRTRRQHRRRAAASEPAELDRVGDRVAAALAEPADLSALGHQGPDVALAINLLFAFANPTHEQLLATYLAKRFPGLSLSVSSDVSPLWREYERASTTILDAFTRPLLKRFLDGLDTRLRQEGYRAPLSVMKSNGGRMLAAAAVDRAVQLLLSGLAGGVVGGRAFGEAGGRCDVITFDMGGTSTDVAVVAGGALTYTTEYQLEFGLPVSVPSLDVVTIGAGGGSIAWIDKGGLLRVGPASAGAEPGPACYGLGGNEPTVTDANFLLGRIGARSLLGGAITLDEAAARRTLAGLGAKLGLSPEDAARAIVGIANENMANSIRILTIERGIDPGEFALVAFGGAGPLHAAEVAGMLGIVEVIIPPNPGLTSALGALLAPPRVDVQRTHVRRGAAIDAGELEEVLHGMRERARSELLAEGYREALETPKEGPDLTKQAEATALAQAVAQQAEAERASLVRRRRESPKSQTGGGTSRAGGCSGAAEDRTAFWASAAARLKLAEGSRFRSSKPRRSATARHSSSISRTSIQLLVQQSLSPSSKRPPR